MANCSLYSFVGASGRREEANQDRRGRTSRDDHDCLRAVRKHDRTTTVEIGGGLVEPCLSRGEFGRNHVERRCFCVGGKGRGGEVSGAPTYSAVGSQIARWEVLEAK